MPRKPRKITARQQQVLDYIISHIRRDGRPPTLREIGREFDMGSTNAARSVLMSLEQKGFLRRHRYLSRGIDLTHPVAPAGNVSRIPIVGRVAAGQPLLAVENREGELLIDRDLFPTDQGFALRVQGQSMSGAGIHDGDIVLAVPDLPVSPGEIVVAVIGDEATVKRFYQEGDHIRLEPENPAYAPIIVRPDADNFRLAGRVVGLYRRF
jgi:repressor LexA